MKDKEDFPEEQGKKQTFLIVKSAKRGIRSPIKGYEEAKDQLSSSSCIRNFLVIMGEFCCNKIKDSQGQWSDHKGTRIT